MEPIIIYFVGGLCAGVLGSFVAARLAGVDRLWALPGKPEPRTLVKPLSQAATVYRATGPSGLVSLAAACDHPLLAYALRQIVEGRSAESIRTSINDRLNAMHRFDRRCQFFGRLLAQFAPVMGIAGMAGAMYLGLSRLQDPDGSVVGLAVAVMLLMVGGNLIALFSRRMSRATPKATSAGQIGGSMIIEAAAMIQEGASSQDVERRLMAMTGDAPAPASFAQAA